MENKSPFITEVIKEMVIENLEVLSIEISENEKKMIMNCYEEEKLREVNRKIPLYVREKLEADFIVKKILDVLKSEK